MCGNWLGKLSGRDVSHLSKFENSTRDRKGVRNWAATGREWNYQRRTVIIRYWLRVRSVRNGLCSVSDALLRSRTWVC
jgi:hypothetical protein